MTTEQPMSEAAQSLIDEIPDVFGDHDPHAVTGVHVLDLSQLQTVDDSEPIN